MSTEQGTPRAGASGVCPACCATGGVFVASNAQVSVSRCPECTLLYSDPQPRAIVAAKYAEVDLAALFSPWRGRKRELFERRLSVLPAPTPGRDRLCDVGAGDGQFLALARARGWRPFGVELTPRGAARAAEQGAEIRLGLLEELEDLPWGAFSLVTCWDVLEHTPDPRPFADRLARLVAPGGLLAVTTLNVDSLAYRWFGVRWSMVGEDHFTYWNRTSLTRVFARCGLVLEDVYTFGLGRDFVAFMDRGRTAPSTNSAPTPVAASGQAQPPASPGWDARPLVLSAENCLNLLFRRFGGGVGIGILMRRP